jgi:hypothetical protein
VGRDGIEPLTSGLKVRAVHQQAQPTACRHKHLVVRRRRAHWCGFGAASVPIVCQSAGRYGLPRVLPGRQHPQTRNLHFIMDNTPRPMTAHWPLRVHPGRSRRNVRISHMPAGCFTGWRATSSKATRRVGLCVPFFLASTCRRARRHSKICSLAFIPERSKGPAVARARAAVCSSESAANPVSRVNSTCAPG